jgi:hypothetical protein
VGPCVSPQEEEHQNVEQPQQVDVDPADAFVARAVRAKGVLDTEQYGDLLLFVIPFVIPAGCRRSATC